MSRGSNPAKVEQWTACLARFQDSGLTVAKFCEEEGVSAPSFYQWRRRLASAAKAGGAARREGNARREMKSARPLVESRNGAAFQSVNVLPAAPAATIRLANGIEIELGSDLRAFDLLAGRLLDGSAEGKERRC